MQESTLIEFNLPRPNSEQIVSANCALVASFPRRQPLQDWLLTIEGEEQNEAWIVVWDLAAPDVSSGGGGNATATWDNRPSRLGIIATVRAAFGADRAVLPLDCSRGSLLSLELACEVGSTGCLLEYEETAGATVGKLHGSLYIFTELEVDFVHARFCNPNWLTPMVWGQSCTL